MLQLGSWSKTRSKSGCMVRTCHGVQYLEDLQDVKPSVVEPYSSPAVVSTQSKTRNWANSLMFPRAQLLQRVIARCTALSRMMLAMLSMHLPTYPPTHLPTYPPTYLYPPRRCYQRPRTCLPPTHSTHTPTYLPIQPPNLSSYIYKAQTGEQGL